MFSAMVSRKLLFCVFLGWALGVASGAAHATTLDQVKQRGYLVCGSNPGLPGFGLPDDNGNWTGFDVDFCRAVAATIFDDPSKVKFVLGAAARAHQAFSRSYPALEKSQPNCVDRAARRTPGLRVNVWCTGLSAGVHAPSRTLVGG